MQSGTCNYRTYIHIGCKNEINWAIIYFLYIHVICLFIHILLLYQLWGDHIIKIPSRGGSRIFMGERGANHYLRAHHKRKAQVPNTARVQGPLKGPVSSRVL